MNSTIVGTLVFEQSGCFFFFFSSSLPSSNQTIARTLTQTVDQLDAKATVFT
jgi:hypothetical protein